MIKSTHLAVQISSNIWLVTFVSELGLTETRRMTSDEFVTMIEREASLSAIPH